MTDSPQSETPFLRDPEAFILYAYTAAESTAGTLYSLIWLLVATKVAVKLRLQHCRAECQAWQAEVIHLRERLGICERAIAPLRVRVSTQAKIIKELEKRAR